jgi:hypothetical protein
MKYIIGLIFLFCINSYAAIQYNVKGNQIWLTFDNETELTLEVDRSGNETNKENFIDKGNGIYDFGWYDMESKEFGSLKNGSIKFNENNKIALWITDNSGKTYMSTKTKDDDYIWGKSRLENGGLSIYGGNFGSNGTKEHYIFKVNLVNLENEKPNGQPLPGIIATLILGFGSIFYIKNRKELLAK